MSRPDNDLQRLLDISAARHSHLCPRQVLGVRMGLYGMALLGLEASTPEKRLLVISEADGCFTDGLQSATGARVGHRTLRIEDYGKVAATFVDVQSGKALRLAPRPEVRQQAGSYAPDEPQLYLAQLKGYQVMPDEQLFSVQPVQLKTPVAAMLSQPGRLVICAACGEEIMNDRQVMVNGQPFCRACAGQAYYR